ncbi:MAG: hypothetical protein KF866_03075 [Phycisphaeraceae bacterium]|nr:hypothetical protein [Phycisphaeraceae bacterium]MCW5753321.1 hypothetical protein [Phycisphaeraceae bacterium]
MNSGHPLPSTTDRGAPARIVHLIEPAARDVGGRGVGSDAACLLCAALIRATPEIEHRVCIFGSTRAIRNARLLGLPVHGRIVPILGRSERSGRAFVRWLEAQVPPDAVHAWSLGTWQSVPLGLGLPAYATLLTHGLPRPNLGAFSTVLWPSSIEDMSLPIAATPPVRQREHLRCELGIDPSAKVLALLADPTAAVDPRSCIWAARMLDLVDLPVVLLVPGSLRLGAAVRTLARELGESDRILCIADPVIALVEAADCAIILDPVNPLAGSILAGATAGRGVPVIAPPECLRGLAPEFAWPVQPISAQQLATTIAAVLRHPRGVSLPPAFDPSPFLRLWTSDPVARTIDA